MNSSMSINSLEQEWWFSSSASQEGLLEVLWEDSRASSSDITGA